MAQVIEAPYRHQTALLGTPVFGCLLAPPALGAVVEYAIGPRGTERRAAAPVVGVASLVFPTVVGVHIYMRANPPIHRLTLLTDGAYQITPPSGTPAAPAATRGAAAWPRRPERSR